MSTPEQFMGQLLRNVMTVGCASAACAFMGWAVFRDREMTVASGRIGIGIGALIALGDTMLRFEENNPPLAFSGLIRNPANT